MTADRQSAEFYRNSGGAHINSFRIGGVSVQITGAQKMDVALVPTLEPFQQTPSSSDISLHVEWVKTLSATGRSRLFDSGTTWRLYQYDDGFSFDFNAPLFGADPYKRLLVDSEFRRGTVQMSEESLANTGALSPLDYPLDELLIMHRLTQEKAIELHGCGIVRANDEGNLFVGHSGAGKSTTTRLWTATEDVEILSDDRIIVRRDEQKQVPHLRFAELRNDKQMKSMRMYGTPWHGEAMYASPASAPLKRIFVLEHGHGNVLTSLSSSQAVAELFARSFVPFHRHEYVESALSFLQEVADAVPVYRYSFEPDQRAVDTILNLRD